MLSAAEVFKWTGDLPQNVNYAVKAPFLSVIAFLHIECGKYPETTFWQNRPADIGIQDRTISNDRDCGIVRLAGRIA